MATSIKILAKRKPAALTGARMYVVPAATSAQGEIVICNQSVSTSVRVAVLSAGITTPNFADYVLFDTTLGAGATLAKTICLGVDESIWVYSTSGEVSFVVMGMEIT